MGAAAALEAKALTMLREGRDADAAQLLTEHTVRLLPTAYCLLPTTYCLLPTAYCLLLHSCSQSTRYMTTTPLTPPLTLAPTPPLTLTLTRCVRGRPWWRGGSRCGCAVPPSYELRIPYHPTPYHPTPYHPTPYHPTPYYPTPYSLFPTPLLPPLPPLPYRCGSWSLVTNSVLPAPYFLPPDYPTTLQVRLVVTTPPLPLPYR